MNKVIHPLFIALMSIAIVLLSTSLKSQSEQTSDFSYTLDNRLIFISSKLNSNDEIKRIFELIDRADALCFNGIVLESNVINYVEGYNPRLDKSLKKSFSNRWKNLNLVLKYAKDLGLKVFPKTVQTSGVSILAHDPNLAEGLPINNLPIVVAKSGRFKILINDPTDKFPLRNWNFNSAYPTGFKHWTFSKSNKISSYNKVFFKIEEGDNKYLKIENPGKFGSGNHGMQQTVTGLKKFREYQIKFKVKTRDFKRPNNFSIEVFNKTTGRYLQRNKPISADKQDRFIQKTQDWKKYYLTFNTLDNDELVISIRNWNGGTGVLYLDDIEITPTLFNNILRRDDTPLVLNQYDGQSLRGESELNKIIIDPQLGNDNWHGSISSWHSKPEIKLPRSSKLRVGDRLLANYYSAAAIKNNGGFASLTHPNVLQIIQDQITQLYFKFEEKGLDMFSGYVFNHDEIRVHGWDNSSRNSSPGENLINNFNYAYDTAKKLDPSGSIFVWNDMFDPYHNAKPTTKKNKPYYLVKGDWALKTGEIPKDVTIINWIGATEINSDNLKRIKSCQYFEKLGHDQILCGYYDAKKFYMKDWLRELDNNNVEKIKGVMYTTWRNNYSKLEEWAKHLWGDCL